MSNKTYQSIDSKLCLFCVLLALIILLNGCEYLSKEGRAKSSNQKGLFFLNKGQYAEAIEKFTKSIELNPDDNNILFDAYFNRGRSYNGLKQYKFAVNDFSKATALKAEVSEVYYHRAIAHFHTRNYQLSLNDYLKTISIGFKSPFPDEMKTTLGNFCIKLGDDAFRSEKYQIAIEYYEKLELIDPTFLTHKIKNKIASSYSEIGKVHLDKKEYSDAITNFKKAYEINSIQGYRLLISNTLMALAQEQAKDERYYSAVTTYKELLQFAPERKTAVKEPLSNALMSLAQEEAKDEDFQSAIEHYKEVLEYSPEQAYEINDIVRLLETIQQQPIVKLKATVRRLARVGENYSYYEISEIVNELESLVRVSFYNNADAHFFLGIAKAMKCLKEASRGYCWSESKKELETATILKTDFAEAHLWLGIVLAREGFERSSNKDEKLLYYVVQLYHLWKKGFSDDWYSSEYISKLPYDTRDYLEKANKEWQRAIDLDYKMKDVFRGVVTKIFADLEK